MINKVERKILLECQKDLCLVLPHLENITDPFEYDYVYLKISKIEEDIKLILKGKN